MAPLSLADAYRRLNITDRLLPVGAANRPGARLTPTQITIHDTANSGKGANALAHARYMEGEDARARHVSWHYSVDDTRAVKHIPLSERAWHAGSTAGNSSSIGIEICVNSDGDFGKAADRAALLTAVLLRSLGLKIDDVVQHKHWTGKECPASLRRSKDGWDWPIFMQSVGDYLEALAEGEGIEIGASCCPCQTCACSCHRA